MSGKRLWAIVPVAVVAVAVLLGQESSSAQESWQPARGGASNWGSGPAVKSTSAAGSGSFGDGAHWSAGTTSFGSARQPGGVWTSGSGFPDTSKSTSGPKAAGSPTPGGMPKPAEARLMPPTGPASAPKSSTPVYRASSGQKSVTGPHLGTAKGGGTNKSSTTKKGPTSSRRRASSGSRTGMSSGFDKPKADSGELNPLGESSPTNKSALDGSTGLEDPLR
jgi:hypothetical protein